MVAPIEIDTCERDTERTFMLSIRAANRALTLSRCSPESVVSPSTDALEALMQMQRTGSDWLLVAADGKLYGVMSLSDMLHVLSLKLELGDLEAQRRPPYSQARPGTKASTQASRPI